MDIFLFPRRMAELLYRRKEVVQLARKFLQDPGGGRELTANLENQGWSFIEHKR